MAAPIKLKNIWRFSVIFYRKLRLSNARYLTQNTRQSLKRVALLSATATGLSTKEEVKLEEPDPATLSPEYLVKAASINTAEHAAILLTHTAVAIQQVEKEYTEALFALVVLMEYKLKVLGNTQEEERIWDIILEARALVEKKRKKKHDFEMILTSASNVVNVSAELAYMTGAELSGSCAGERLYKVEQHLKLARKESEEAEVKLREVEVKTVHVEGKRSEDMKVQQEALKRLEESLAKEADKVVNNDGGNTKVKDVNGDGENIEQSTDGGSPEHFVNVYSESYNNSDSKSDGNVNDQSKDNTDSFVSMFRESKEVEETSKDNQSNNSELKTNDFVKLYSQDDDNAEEK